MAGVVYWVGDEIYFYAMTKKQTIKVEGIKIITFTKNNSDYISLTDIARHKNPAFPADVIKTG